MHEKQEKINFKMCLIRIKQNNTLSNTHKRKSL